MSNELLAAAALAWIAAAVVALIGRLLGLARILLGFGGLAGIAAAVATLPGGTETAMVPLRMAGETATLGWRLRPSG